MYITTMLELTLTRTNNIIVMIIGLFPPPEELQVGRLDSGGPGREPARGDSPGPGLSPLCSAAQKPGPVADSPPTEHPSSLLDLKRTVATYLCISPNLRLPLKPWSTKCVARTLI